MRPYIIINGVNSETVKGLLISALPPISKPKVRVTLEEIDGRDGDIATVLGYAAYDKPISIGLYGDYDIDAVIKYFNSSGKVIFSNEADKYYNFAIYEAIDFNKLIRYKTATVNMHVQPFKYSAEEVEKSFNIRGESNIITVRNNGNIYAKPTITLTGSGAVDIYIGTAHFGINLTGVNETIIIDVQGMNAYDLDGNFKNREVVGDYDTLRLDSGVNNITINGNVTSFKINNYSRWI